MRDDYVQIWNGLSDEHKKTLINKSVDQLDHFNKYSYSSKDISTLQFSKNKEIAQGYSPQTATAQQMNWDEVMLKVIWQMSQDIRVYESVKDYDNTKKYLKDVILSHSQNNKKNFIYTCVSPNLADCLKVERFFMNLMMRYVHDLYIDKNINEFCDEETNDLGDKKKKKKKKRNRKKNKQSQIKNVDSKNEQVNCLQQTSSRHLSISKPDKPEEPLQSGNTHNTSSNTTTNVDHKNTNINSNSAKMTQTKQEKDVIGQDTQQNLMAVKNIVKNKSAIQKEFLENENNFSKKDKKDSIQKTKNELKYEESTKILNQRKSQEKKKEEYVKQSKTNKKYKFKLKRSNKDRRVNVPHLKKESSRVTCASLKHKEKLQRRNFSGKEEHCLKGKKGDNLDKDMVSGSSTREQLSETSSKIKKWTESNIKDSCSDDSKSNQTMPKTTQSEIYKKKNRKKKTGKNPKWGSSKPQPPLKWGQEDSKPINFVPVKQKSVSSQGNSLTNDFKFSHLTDTLDSTNFKYANSEYNRNMPVYFHNENSLNRLHPNLMPNQSYLTPLQSLNDPLFFNATHNKVHSDKFSMESYPEGTMRTSPEKGQSPNRNEKDKEDIPSESVEESPLNKLINSKRVEINNLTKEAFYEFTGNSIKRIIKRLKCEAEELRPHREIILNRINKIIHKSFKTEEVNVVPYGSFETGLLTPSSDLDLAITFFEPTITSAKEKHYFLETLESNLKLFPFVKTSKTVLSAVVPVIKIEADASVEFKHLSGKMDQSRIIKVDIIVGSFETNRDMNSAFKTTNFIKHVLSIYPSLFDVSLFFKYILTTHGLANAFKGGFNAYGFSILIIAFLKFYSLDQSTDVGRITLEFLHFFCNIFEPSTTAVNCKYSELTPPQPFIPYDNFMTGVQLLILDPTSIIPKNVTASCYKFYQIRNFFSQCLTKILNAQVLVECNTLKELEVTLNQNVPKACQIKLVPDEGMDTVLNSNMEDNKINHVELPNCAHSVNSTNPREAKSTQSDNNCERIFETKLEEKKNNIENETSLKLDQLEKQQIENINQFGVQKSDLVKTFDDMYSNFYEVVFSLNGKETEEPSSDYLVHAKLQSDLTFNDQGKLYSIHQ